MPQNKEAEAFLERIKSLPAGPGVSLDDALKPSIEDETELRRYFANDRDHARLKDPYVGLVDVFDAPVDIRTTRARVVKTDDDGVDQIAKQIMPVPEAARRAEGTPCMVDDLDEFKKNWSIFTEGSLSQLFDWNNVVAAGGSVLACLTPLEDKNKVSKRAIRKHYHSAAYPTSDVDLFLWGMTPEQAEAKIIKIYEAVRDSVPWDVTCIRTKHTVSIHSQYPYRSVQIVLRLYHSPAEILAGFDIDSPSCAYDGERVWANPRAIVAMMRQCNTIDITRRSPSYEVRLTKYANRGYEVYVPDLEREKIDPTIYERAINKMEGLARLLVFERLIDGDARFAFLESRRKLRGRPNPLSRYRRDKRRHYKGDLKVETAIGGLEMNDYDVVSLHVPYGPGWDARRIDKLVYQTDLGMNSTFNPKNKGRRLHRHPAFFGTMEECMEDCCETCPEPIDDDERELMASEDDKYIVGRIKFIEDNPGRQTMTGSFNPIDAGEWSEQVYVKETEKFFAAVARNNLDAVKEHIKAEIDLNHRDHVGRTCLHVAILCHAKEVALELIEAGARISARLVDGRSALHLASRYGQVEVVKKLLERNAANQANVKKEGDEEDDTMDEDSKLSTERPSSEDDWSSHAEDGADVEMKDADGDDEDSDNDDEEEDEDEDSDEDSDEGGGKKKKAAAEEPPESNAGDLPEDDEDEPDVFDINESDWDFGFSPLAYATLFASHAMIDLLLTSGADVNKATTTNHNDAKQLHPLYLTILREDEDEACTIAERLIKAGASSSTADQQTYTILHDFIGSGKLKLASTVFKCDPNAKKVVNIPAIKYNEVIFPLVTAIQQLDYGMIALLLAHGAKTDISEDDIVKAMEIKTPQERSNTFGYGVKYIDQAFLPLETALSRNDDVAQLVLAFGAAVNVGIKCSKRSYCYPNDRRTIKDWVDRALLYIDEAIERAERNELEPQKPSDLETPAELVFTGWKEHLQEMRKANLPVVKQVKVEEDAETLKWKANEEAWKVYNKADKILDLHSVKDYLRDIQRLLDARNAKSWNVLFPGIETNLTFVPSKPSAVYGETSRPKEEDENSEYVYVTNYYRGSYVPMSQSKRYDELYEACFAGDDAKIKQLCLPSDGEEESDVPLLNVNVQIGDPKNVYHSSGWTPLFAACAARRWNTAKLVVAIAAAQYKPSEDGEAKVTFKNISLDDDDDDSDNESDCSDCSDDTIGQKKEALFIDIAKVKSTVTTDVPPKKMISELGSTFRVGDAVLSGNLLHRAIRMKDREALINIANLYASLSTPVDLGVNSVDVLLSVDSPELLDEFIRLSGYGLDFEVAKKALAHLPQIVNDENRIYMGLNVHGKKRADLAQKNDPNATSGISYTEPLVWKAAKARALECIQYLATEKPLAAFKHHATAHSDSRAEHLRRIENLEEVMSDWLGWKISTVGESPLTAAIAGNSLPAIKALFAAKPEFMKGTLHRTIHFIGHNAFLLAVELQTETEILDFLLAKSISPAVHDTPKGWNAVHHVCFHRNLNLLKYLRDKLPKDVFSELLKRQSKGRLNTPLHIAVKQGSIEMVRTILEFDSSTALFCNIDGQTPLHYAVAQSFPDIIEQLLDTPELGGLFKEDTIGQTPFELAALKEQLVRLKKSSRASISMLPSNSALETPNRIGIETQTEGIADMKAVLKQVVDDGILENVQDFTFKINSFIATLESNIEQWKKKLSTLPEEPETRPPAVVENPTDVANVEKAWRVVEKALKAATQGQRELIKLIDVQLSVKANLDQVARKSRDEDKDSDDEEDPEDSEWSQMTFRHRITKNADAL